MKRKIAVVVTARPSYSRIRTALAAIKSHPDLELQLFVSGSALIDRYGNVSQVIESDGFKIDSRVFMLLDGENLVTSAKSTGLSLVELATVLDNHKPDAVVSIADRYETIATAIAAAYQNIPLVHIQGGEITGSIDEKVRHAVTKLADVHLVSTELAGERVSRMGERKESIYVTGCPSIDIASQVLKDPSLNFNPYDKYGGVGKTPGLENGYAVVMQHPVTTEEGAAADQILETLEAVKGIEVPVLWFWPNVDAGTDSVSKMIRIQRERGHLENVHLFRNMQPDDFLRLIYNSRVLIGNSSVGIRESSFLGIPTVNIGTRQSGRERGRNVADVGYNRTDIHDMIQKQAKHGYYQSDHIYGDGRAGERIADVLATCPLTIEKRLAY